MQFENSKTGPWTEWNGNPLIKNFSSTPEMYIANLETEIQKSKRSPLAKKLRHFGRTLGKEI